ncbi:DinB family protein [Stenotrophomonas sp. NRRL B-14846]|uniref:DinB family protein n=1 Tax=Stenotrophomonas sp. NRRL B-14846 TaxID=3162882 RepID=UPI003D2D09B2
MARYNAWANQRLYAAVEPLPDEDYRRPCGAFFGSVERTLNHLLVTDRIWLRRLAGQGDTGYALDTLLFTDFTALRQARIEEMPASSRSCSGCPMRPWRPVSPIDACPRPNRSCSGWTPGWHTGSTTRPITAARYIPC